MGMFDSLYIKKADHLVEVQTKQLESTLDRYYWGDMIKKEAGVSFLVEDYSYAENHEYNDWFIFVLLNGFYVDYAVVKQAEHIEYTKNKLNTLWSNPQLQNITLSFLMEKSYELGQEKTSLVNNIRGKVEDYLEYLDNPKKPKNDRSFHINHNQYQDKQVSMKDFLNDVKEVILSKQKKMYGSTESLEVQYDELFNRMSDVGRMQNIESKVLQYVYLNQDKFNFSLDEIILSHTLQPLILSLNVDLNKTIFFNMDDFKSLPTYFEYLFNYIKLPSELFHNFVKSHWSELSYEQKSSLFYNNLIEDYKDNLSFILNQYSEKEWVNLITHTEFWYNILEHNNRLELNSNQNLIDMTLDKIKNVNDFSHNKEMSFLGAFIESIKQITNTESINNLQSLSHHLIKIAKKHNVLYLHKNNDKEQNLWQKASESNETIELIHAYYEKKQLENNMQKVNKKSKNSVIKL